MTTINTYNYDADCAKQNKGFIKWMKFWGGVQVAGIAAVAILNAVNPPAECFGPAGCYTEVTQDPTTELITVIGDGGHIEYID